MERFAAVYLYGSVPAAPGDEQEATAAVMAGDARKSRGMVFVELCRVWPVLCSLMLCGRACAGMDDCRDLANDDHIRLFIGSAVHRVDSNTGWTHKDKKQNPDQRLGYVGCHSSWHNSYASGASPNFLRHNIFCWGLSPSLSLRLPTRSATAK